MNLLKELRHAFKCDHISDLARLVGIQPQTMAAWNTRGVPKEKQGMLKMLLEKTLQVQKLEIKNQMLSEVIERLKMKLEEIDEKT